LTFLHALHADLLVPISKHPRINPYAAPATPPPLTVFGRRRQTPLPIIGSLTFLVYPLNHIGAKLTMKIFLETKILMPRFLNVCYRRNKISPECK
jgi:hypothetical protein